jgi:hypothetical protein
MSKITLNQHRQGITQTLIAKFSDDKEPRQGLSAFFPSKTTSSKLISIEVERNLQLVAVDVQRCTDPVRNTFSRSTEKIFEPPYYHESFDFTACERYDVTFAQGNAPTRIDATMLLRDAQSKVKKLKNKILRAIELQRSQVLQTGIVLLKNGDSIDYKRKAESLAVNSGAANWNVNTSDPYADIEKGMEFMREEGLSGGTTINAIFGKKAFTNFMNHEKVQKQADIRKIDRTTIGMPQFNNITGMALHGQFAAGDFTINIWTYNETYIDPADNTTRRRYINEDNVVLVADDFEGVTSFAGVPAIMGDVVSGQYIAPMEGEFYVRDIIDQVKMAWDFIISSAPLVVPVSVDRIWTLKTRS